MNYLSRLKAADRTFKSTECGIISKYMCCQTFASNYITKKNNMRSPPNVGLTMRQRRRRWYNTISAVGQRLVLSGITCYFVCLLRATVVSDTITSTPCA